MWEYPVSQQCQQTLEDFFSKVSQQRHEVSKFDATFDLRHVNGGVPTHRMIIMLQTMRWIMWKHRCHVVHLVAGNAVLSLSHFFISEIHRIAEINVHFNRDSLFL